MSTSNRLAFETSPYLLQHAHNPVDWYPWSEEALAQARQQDKPILLSIGYSACHWCHVMAHESFEDPATAQLMNDLFINVKVDREERPDLDKVYQLAHQVLTQRSGGWPLTVFLSPHDLVPFFSGTYFPREARYGLPAFKDLLSQIAQVYRVQKVDVLAQNEALQTILQRIQSGDSRQQGASLTPAPITEAIARLAAEFDADHGGFGGAPKFPQPVVLAGLLQLGQFSTEDTNARHMVEYTLQHMADGGLQDHLGGGFYRYSVDEAWRIPHFEKMLYDNAQLLSLYAHAWHVSGEANYRQTALDIVRWLAQDMGDSQGGYYSSLDADSEGEEGKYYLWTPMEVAQVLPPEEYALFAPCYGLDQPANFEQRWHLQRLRTPAQVAQRQGLPLAQVEQSLMSSRERLLQACRLRTPPHRDDKILVSWNALMIKGLADAARYLGQPELLDRATRAVDFIRTQLWQDNKLRVTYKDGQARFAAYLDDHAFLLSALLTLLQTRWRRADLEFAMALADILLDEFQDEVHGGFYFTAHDHESLIYRPKPYADDANPSGNGMAAQALLLLGHLVGERRYIEAVEKTLKAAWPHLVAAPQAHCSLLMALQDVLSPPTLIILGADAADLPAWQPALAALQSLPWHVFVIPGEGNEHLPGLLDHQPALALGAAYICEGYNCLPPKESPEELIEFINQKYAY